MKIRVFAAVVAAAFLGACAGSPPSSDSGNRKIANVDPVEVGKVGVGTKSLMASSVNQSEVTVVFEPRTNLALLVFKYESMKARLTLSEEARTVFIKAVAEYQKNYDERTLNIRAKRTDGVYGTAKALVEWGGMAYSGKAQPKIKYGYLFVNRKAPYCTITVPSSENIGEQADAVRSDDNSPTIILYFTKNQAAELGEMLLQENLEGILQERGIRDYSEDPDAYES